MSGKTFLQLLNDKVDAGDPPPCISRDPESFFPHLSENVPENRRDIERAKAVCRKCPIIADCLEFALDTDDRWAIMGGTSPSDRTIIAFKRETRAEKRRQQKQLEEASRAEFDKERKSWSLERTAA